MRERIYNEPEKVTPRDAVGCSNYDTPVEAATRQELAARVVAAAVDVGSRNLRVDSPGRFARAWCREAENTRDPLQFLL